MVAKNDSYIYEYTIANLLIKTMSDIVANNSDIIAALNQAICDFNERLMEHKEYFCNEIKKLEQGLSNLEQRLTRLEFKMDMFIAISMIMFAMIWYQIFCLDMKIDRLEAKFDAKFERLEAKFDNLQHLLIQILLKNQTSI
jgi:uncharacterized coiled-coil protein SlyX